MNNINFNKVPITILTGNIMDILAVPKTAGFYYAIKGISPNDLECVKHHIIRCLDRSINYEGLPPAGLERGIFRLDINEPSWSMGDCDLLYSNDINPIRYMLGTYVIWGVKFVPLDGVTSQRVYGYDYYDMYERLQYDRTNINPRFIDLINLFDAFDPQQ